MIITFCGHSRIIHREGLRESILSAIEERAKGEDVTFYLGAYGDFDGIARDACLDYKKQHPTARLIFITPYLNDAYLKGMDIRTKGCDETIYPEIETTPKRYAILKRNEWMMRRADYVIAYVKRAWGGAAKSLNYARTHGKPVLNLATEGKT